jgi:hypothetical protein
MNNFVVVVELLNVGGVLVCQVVQKITVYKGDSFKARCWLRDPHGRVVSITGYTITVEVGPTQVDVTPLANIAGEFEFSITAAQCAELPVGSHELRFKILKTATGDLTRVIQKAAVDIKALA